MPEATTSARDGLPSRLEDIHRSERTMVLVRWAAVVFATVQVLVYSTHPYPAGVRSAALLLIAALAVANLAIMLISGRDPTLRGARLLSVTALSIDVLLASGFVWLYAFDQASALWAILFILPLEGAIRFALPGALAAWAAATLLYIGREVWGSERYDYPLEWNSISFRMGIGFLIALVAGLMARSLIRQRSQLGDALVELSRTDALRSRMVATLAHDVRNPLTTIRGTLKTLARYGERLQGPVRDQMIESADRQAARLERLAADLLDLARVQRGRLELRIEDVPLAEIVDRGLSFADEHHGFEVRIDPGLTVRADPARLEQIVVNLASNALRYGEPPYSVEASLDGAGRVSLRFRDHGPGVPEEEMGGLFEPFRADSDRSSVGLGLAIVRALAEAQGGDAAYEPNSPRGACFRVSLRSASDGEESG